MEQTISVCPQQDNFCALLWAQLVLVVKNLPANARDARDVGLIPVRKILWKRKLQLTSVFLLEESHEQRSLVGNSPWTDMTEATWHTWALLGIYCFRQNTEPTCLWLLHSWQDYKANS